MRFLCVNTELGPLLVVDCGLVLTEAAPPDCLFEDLRASFAQVPVKMFHGHSSNQLRY